MNVITRVIWCGVAMSWALCGYAGEAKPSEPAPKEMHSSTAAKKKPVAARVYKVDRAKVENRMQQRAARTQARTEMAEKDVAERKAREQQSRTKKVPE